jgi:hypothetical protein
LFCDVTFSGGLHVGKALFNDRLLNHVYTRRPEDIAEPRYVGDTGEMDGIFGETLNAAFLAVRVGLINSGIPRIINRVLAKLQFCKNFLPFGENRLFVSPYITRNCGFLIELLSKPNRGFERSSMTSKQMKASSKLMSA